MSDHVPFIERVLAGEIADLDAIDDDIAAWHDSATVLPLHEWLGMTDDEYTLFVERRDALRVIVAAREHHDDPRAG
jgi:hypothetical protein